jgi:hypothetical protein
MKILQKLLEKLMVIQARKSTPLLEPKDLLI